MVIESYKRKDTLKMDPEEVYKRFPPGCMLPLRSLVYTRSERKAVARALHILVEHGRVLKYPHHRDFTTIPYETYTNMYMRAEDNPNTPSLYRYRRRHKKPRIVPYIPEKEQQEPEEEQEERHTTAITLDDYLIGI